jgi:hypothetical protein
MPKIWIHTCTSERGGTSGAPEGHMHEEDFIHTCRPTCMHTHNSRSWRGFSPVCAHTHTVRPGPPLQREEGLKARRNIYIYRERERVTRRRPEPPHRQRAAGSPLTPPSIDPPPSHRLGRPQGAAFREAQRGREGETEEQREREGKRSREGGRERGREVQREWEGGKE